jgi:hypothetical protein
MLRRWISVSRRFISERKVVGWGVEECKGIWTMDHPTIVRFYTKRKNINIREGEILYLSETDRKCVCVVGCHDNDR